MRWLSVPLLLMLAALPAQAKEYQVVQGGVATLDHAAASHATLRCLDRQWPVRRMSDGSLRGWVGIDLKTRPGTYRCRWHYDGGKESVSLQVTKGEFRISRIQVKRKMAVFDAPTLKRIRHDQQALKQSYRAHVDATPDIVMHAMPVAGIISTPFGAQRYVNGEPRSPHSGLDIAAPEGTPITAPLAGKVVLASAMYLNGNTVVIGHGDGLVTIYCHMAHLDVKQGEWIKAGERIGVVGMTGRSTGPHLHWGIRFHNARINPAALLKEQ